MKCDCCDFQELKRKILNGLKLSHKKLVEEKITTNDKIIVSEEGKVVHKDPKTIKTS
jgi:hypothetical protein